MEQSRDDDCMSALKPVADTVSHSAYAIDMNDTERGSSIDPKPGWTCLLVLAGVSTTLGCSLPVGYGIGVVNTPAEIIKQFCNESIYSVYDKELSTSSLDILWSAVVSVFIVGGMTGSLTGSWVADRIGRKGTLVVSNIMFIISAVLFICCKNLNSVELLILGRLILGVSGGLITSTMPMYLTELSPIEQRGAMGVMCPLGLTFGVLFSQIMGLKVILGTETTWHYLLAFYGILNILTLVVIPFLPESPKYLFVVKNQPQLAVRELCRVRSMKPEMLTSEIDGFRNARAGNEDSGEVYSIGRVLKDPSLRLPLMLVCALQAGQQLSGINAVFYYSVTIFKSAGLSDESSQYANIGAGFVNFKVALLVIPLTFYIGRKTLAQFSVLSAAGSLLLLMLSIIFISATDWMPYLCIVAVMLFVFTYGLGLGPIPYFIGSELFDVGPRPAAMALGSMSNWAGNFLVGMFFPTIQFCIGPYSFLIFITCCLCLFFFLRTYLPETKGQDVSHVMKLCSNGLKSRPLVISSSNSRDSNDTVATIPVADVKVKSNFGS